MDKRDHLSSHLHFIKERLEEAYDRKPEGSWLEVWVPGFCQHLKVRCTHGDEIIHRRGRRQVCMICGRALKRPLPQVCFFSGEDHK